MTLRLVLLVACTWSASGISRATRSCRASSGSHAQAPHEEAGHATPLTARGRASTHNRGPPMQLEFGDASRPYTESA